MPAVALVLAAGSSTRMGSDKLWADLGGKPVLLWSLEAFQAADSIAAILVVAREERLADVRALSRDIQKVIGVCPGGARRQNSVRAGLDLLGHAPYDVIAVHDGARPLVSPETIGSGVALARDKGAAVAAVPVTDTIKLTDADHIVRQTLPRDQLWAVQTPQCFRLEILQHAHNTVTVDVTDDASMLELAGLPVHLYPGERRNIKVTTPEDLVFARALTGG